MTDFRSSSFSDSSKNYPCRYSPSFSCHSLRFLGAIAARRTSPTVCMDHIFILSTGATYDRVHRMGYVGFRSHDGGGDYAGISWETTDLQMRACVLYLKELRQIGICSREAVQKSAFWRSGFENLNPIETVAATGFQPNVCYDEK